MTTVAATGMGFPMMVFATVTALDIGTICQFTRNQNHHCRIGVSGNTTIKPDLSCRSNFFHFFSFYYITFPPQVKKTSLTFLQSKGILIAKEATKGWILLNTFRFGTN